MQDTLRVANLYQLELLGNDLKIETWPQAKKIVLKANYGYIDCL